MRIGNIVLLSYKTKSKAGSYRLRVVLEVKLGEDGLVHTVRVTYSLPMRAARGSQQIQVVSLHRERRVTTRRRVPGSQFVQGRSPRRL